MRTDNGITVNWWGDDGDGGEERALVALAVHQGTPKCGATAARRGQFTALLRSPDRLNGESDQAWWVRLALLCPECAEAEGERRDPYMLAERIATND